MPNYPVPYQNSWNYGGVGQQMYPQYQQQSMMQQPQQVASAVQQGDHGLKWVDGEVGAKAYQMPAGWPPNTPIALWDTNDTVIYLKSMNPMGMPNPLQKIHYQMEENVPKYIGQSGTTNLMSGEEKHEDYVRKDEFDKMKDELMQSIREVRDLTGRHTAKGE